MTEQEQKAFTAMREALENHPGNHVLTKAECAAIEQALTAANAVSEQPKVIQVMGLNVFLDPTMKPNEMELVQPQAQGEALPIEGSEAADNAIHAMLRERQWPSSSMNAARAGWRAARLFAHPQATEPAGWRLVPLIPTEEQWGGLARDIMMWLDMDGRKTAGSLFKHLERCGTSIPQWLLDEPEMKNLDHVPSKGTRVTIIYRAMLAAAPEAP